LIVSAAKAGLEQADQNAKYPRVDEIPFSSSRKMMSTIHKTKKGYLLAAKGAPDVLLNHCDRIYYGGKIRKLTKQLKEEVLTANSGMAKQALRVLAFAYKEQSAQPGGKSAETKLVFVGLQGMMDPPRIEVKEVMHRVHAEAGMRVIMITGDYIDTATAVAEEIGISGEAISGVELDELSQAEFERRVEKIAVYARVNPEHKIRIVQALKKHGHQVAMTGDGVNDAPAIKAADIGIAMGITGTDASKEAADLILLDDQFLTIIGAIEEGRGIFDNVRKFVNYLLSANIAEVLTILGGVVFLGHLALTAAQLLFINIVTDGLPAIALGSDPAEKGIMRFKPHRFQEAIITKRVWAEMLVFGALMSIILLVHFWWIGGHQHELLRGTAVAFTAMVVYEMVRLIGIRSDYKIRWFSNPWLSVAILASFVLQVLVLYFSPLAEVFEVSPIHAIDWALIGAGSLFLFVVMKLLSPLLDKLFAEAQPQYDAAHYERA
jgi:Ca2+-transporting ATPase